MTVVERRPLCVGADVYIGPPTGLAVGWRLRVSARLRPQCRAGVFARRLGFAALRGFRDDASTAARMRCFGAQSTKCRLLARRSSPTKHRARSCRVCRISPPQTGNAPLRLRLTAHPPSGLRCPHRTARAEARLCSATAALPRSGKDRSGERRAILCFLSPNRR